MPTAHGLWQAKSTPPLLRVRGSSCPIAKTPSTVEMQISSQKPCLVCETHCERSRGRCKPHLPPNIQHPTSNSRTPSPCKNKSIVLFRPTTTSSRPPLLNSTHDTQLQPLQALPKHHNPHIIPPLQNPPLDPLKPDFPKLQVQKLVF